MTGPQAYRVTRARARRVHSSALLLSGLLACAACGSGKKTRGGSESHARELTCGSNGCASSETHSRSERAPDALAATIRAHGEGLPAGVPAASYEQILAATRVRAEGRLTTSAGPASVRAWSPGDGSLELAIMFAPLPNLARSLASIGGSARLRVERVLDARGRDLLDHARAASDAELPLALWDERPVGVGLGGGDQELKLEGLELPGISATPLYATHTLPLARKAALSEVATIEGSLQLRLPSDVTVVESRALSETVERSGLTLRFSRQGERSMKIVAKGTVDRLVAYRARNAGGGVLESSSCSELEGEQVPGQARTKTVECTYLSLRELHALDVAVAGGWFEKSYPFRLAR